MNSFVPDKLPLPRLPWQELVPLIGKANRALAHYDGVLCGVQNAELLLTPLTTQEAVLSSRIEGTQASFSEVLQFEAGEKPREIERQIDIQEILNYRRALFDAEENLQKRPFTLNLLRRLHATLLDSVRGRDQGRGEFRKIQNWIGRHESPIEKAEFIPPSPIILADFLDNWEKFYHSDQPDPLVQLAIVHAQFEILHPFRDGNGRIGRILIPLFLYEKKLLSRPTFYLSECLEENREGYIQSLRAIGRNDAAWMDWIKFFLDSVEQQARRNADKARSIMGLYERLKNEIINLTRSRYAVPLLDRIFKTPVFLIRDIDLDSGKPSKPMMANLVRKLKEADIITAIRPGSGRRGYVYAVRELINLCEGRKIL